MLLLSLFEKSFKTALKWKKTLVTTKQKLQLWKCKLTYISLDFSVQQIQNPLSLTRFLHILFYTLQHSDKTLISFKNEFSQEQTKNRVFYTHDLLASKDFVYSRQKARRLFAASQKRSTKAVEFAPLLFLIFISFPNVHNRHVLVNSKCVWKQFHSPIM